jgi:prevent-host-death family protein
MDSKHTLSITEARKKFFAIANDVEKSGAHYTLTDKGRPKAVIMSIKQLESWHETIDILAHHPNIMKDVKQAEKDYREGKISFLQPRKRKIRKK